MLWRELKFKMPAQLCCSFDLEGRFVCVCVCTLIFPALVPAYLPCRYSCFGSDLNVWVFVPVLTRLHRASFFFQLKDVLSPTVIQWKIYNSQFNSSVCKSTNHHMSFTFEPICVCEQLRVGTEFLRSTSNDPSAVTLC